MIKVYVSLGSNLNDPQQQIKQAIILLEMVPSTTVVKISSLYQSKPVGPQDQPDYINAVVELDTELTTHILLDYLQGIETQQQRDRKERWGPRTLDIDILLYGEQTITDDRLQVPHIEMHKRGFVLLPLSELSGTLAIPGFGPVSTLLRQVDKSDLKKLI